jgi:hypothetical protein
MRIVAPDYLPNEMDVLRARTKTTGIYETRFQMGQLSIQYVEANILETFKQRAADCSPLACLTLAGKGVSERSGYTASRTLHQSFSALR